MRTNVIEAGKPVTVACGRCHRNLGRMTWPEIVPDYWSDEHAELDVHDWLYQRDRPGHHLSRGPIRAAGRHDRLTILNSDHFQFRLECVCKCGHRGRLRLHKVRDRVVNGTLAIP